MLSENQKFYALRTSVSKITATLLKDGYQIGLIPKADLVDNQIYSGIGGKLTTNATWMKKSNKFRMSNQRDATHPEDDNGSDDLFLPFH